MSTPLIAEKIYTALKNIAQGEKEILIKRGHAAAAVATNMPVPLVRQWLDQMATLGWIQMDGYTIWLSRDYGPRIRTVTREERAILEGQKIPKRKGKRTRKVRSRK